MVCIPVRQYTASLIIARPPSTQARAPLGFSFAPTRLLPYHAGLALGLPFGSLPGPPGLCAVDLRFGRPQRERERAALIEGNASCCRQVRQYDTFFNCWTAIFAGVLSHQIDRPTREGGRRQGPTRGGAAEAVRRRARREKPNPVSPRSKHRFGIVLGGFPWETMSQPRGYDGEPVGRRERGRRSAMRTPSKTFDHPPCGLVSTKCDQPATICLCASPCKWPRIDFHITRPATARLRS